MFASLKKLYLEFSLDEKRRLIIIACIIVLSALVQVVGIASIFPFISVASDPSIVETNKYLFAAKAFFEIEENNNFIVLLGVFVFITMVLTNVFLAFSTWMTMKFVVNTNHALSLQLLQKYLGEKYLFHLQHNSASLFYNIAGRVPRVVDGCYMSAINIVSKGFTVFCILLLLIAADPIAAVSVGALLGGAYTFIYLSIRLRLHKVGIIVTKLWSERIRSINESLGGIKELQVLGREHHYLHKFKNISDELIKHQVFSQTVSEMPRYLLETVAFGSLIIIATYFVAVRDDVTNVLPIISLYGLAGYRMLPALQSIFASTSRLKHDINAVDNFYADIKSSEHGESSLPDANHTSTSSMPLKKRFFIDNISFHYPDTTKKALANLSISIEANTSIGIVGTSGSGKSTLVDIILGLIHPQQGKLFVDDQVLTGKNIRKWQNNIGYVPQVIFLADTSISENIAFGVASSEIDFDAVERAAKMANLHDFITDELDSGYDTIVGEHGVRLSGGQRQRIGIARALYHNPNVLVLDEATSALDSPTEKAVMKAVYDLSHKKTIIMIAHRLSTVRHCDQIIRMENGVIKDQGAFDDLMLSSPSFKQFVESGTAS